MDEYFSTRSNGSKPLFYSINNKNIIFASEIKAILAKSMVKAQVDRDGITELFALGPAVTQEKLFTKIFQKLHQPIVWL